MRAYYHYRTEDPGMLKSIRLIFTWVLGVTLLLRWHSDSSSFWKTTYIRGMEDVPFDERVQLTPDQHTIPTLLSVVDDAAGDYVYSLANPLYEIFKDNKIAASTGGNEDVSFEDNPLLFLEPSEIRIREPLILKWTIEVRDDDVLALSCTPPGNFLDLATVAQATATSAKHGGAQNNTWYFPSFPVLRRDECWFSLYRKQSLEDVVSMSDNHVPTLLNSTYNLLAVSQKVRILDAQLEPTGIHLAYSGNIDEMVVQFKTGAEGIPVVEYGFQFDQRASGKSHTYGVEDMCHEPANQQESGKFIPPGILHVVTMTGLELDTTYWYRVGLQQKSYEDTVWSEPFSFVSAPPVKADADPFKILVYGDQGCPALGWGDGGLWISGMAKREVESSGPPLRAIHHFGDLSYAIGAAHIWDEWLNMISNFTTRVPLMVGVGNHEYDHWAGAGHDPSGVDRPDGYHPSWGNYHNDSGGECGVPTANHFTMPKSKGSNGVFCPGSIQHQWFKDDLKAVDHSVTPWIIVELHRPLYESEVAPWDYKVGVALRIELEDLLLEHQVDLVFGGHYHAYQRSCSGLYKSKCNSGGPTHITVGSAGASLTKNPIFPNDWTEKVVQETFGYGRITVANSTALHFELVQAGSWDDPNAGRILDEVWLTKGGNSLEHETASEQRLTNGGMSSISQT